MEASALLHLHILYIMNGCEDKRGERVFLFNVLADLVL